MGNLILMKVEFSILCLLLIAQTTLTATGTPIANQSKSTFLCHLARATVGSKNCQTKATKAPKQCHILKATVNKHCLAKKILRRRMKQTREQQCKEIMDNMKWLCSDPSDWHCTTLNLSAQALHCPGF